MIKLPLLGVVLTFATAFFVIGLVAFRLLWTAPFAAQLRVLPKGWQRWILGEPRR